MIHLVDAALVRLLVHELSRRPGCPIVHHDQISFDPPSRTEAERDGEARLNLYLYDVRENLERREEGVRWVASGTGPDSLAGMKPAPTLIDLWYVLSAHAEHDPLTEHRLLSDVLSVFLRFRAMPQQHLSGDLAALSPGAVLMAIARDDHPHALDFRMLWQSLGTRMRPGLSLLVTVPFDPYETTWARRVREAVLSFRQGTPQPRDGGPELVRIGLSVAGIIVDQQHETPLAGATVTPVDGPPAVTDAEGLFLFRSLPPGAQTLRFDHPRYHSDELTVTVPSPARGEAVEPLVVALRPLSDHERAEQVAEQARALRARPGGALPELSLCGLLRHANGLPAAGIPVRVAGYTAVTDSEGIYYFFDLPPGPRRPLAELPGGEVEISASNL